MNITEEKVLLEKVLLEYVWIDSDNNVRSKVKIISNEDFNKDDINSVPEWNFDGSSTGQAEGRDSDVLLRPCALYPNPFCNYMVGYLVMCECWNKDGTPHITNHRVKLVQTYNECANQEPWFGIEQEYIMFERREELRNEYPNENSDENSDKNSDKNSDENSSVRKVVPLPYKWNSHDKPGFGPQGPYYCGVGGGVCFGRNISQKHLEMCLKAGLKICGTNAEVMASQWEYQIGPLNPLEISDQMWISRYILNRISEEYECVISFHPKPYKGDWNGSGGHTNFSTRAMREPNGIKYIYEACEKLALTHSSHMKVYGRYNDERLTGKHETSSINDFSWGISNRGKSIRIPLNVVNDTCGYLEDRRPAANLDPYLVCEAICASVCK